MNVFDLDKKKSAAVLKNKIKSCGDFDVSSSNALSIQMVGTNRVKYTVQFPL